MFLNKGCVVLQMVSKVEFETIDTRSLELESSISHMTIIFEVRTIYRLLYNSTAKRHRNQDYNH